MDKIAKAVRRAEVNGFVAGLIDSGIMKVANEEEAAVVADVIEEHLPEDYDMEDAMAIAAEVVDALGGEAEGEGYEDEGYEDDGMVVEASDKSDVNMAAVMAAYGELTMAKEAGDISEGEFEKQAVTLKGIVGGAKNLYKGDYAGFAGQARRHVNAAKQGLGSAFGAKALRRGLSESGEAGDKMKALADAAAKKNAVRQRIVGEGNAYTKATAQQQPGFIGLTKQRSAAKSKALKGAAATGAAYGTTGVGAAYGGQKLYDKYNQ